MPFLVKTFCGLGMVSRVASHFFLIVKNFLDYGKCIKKNKIIWINVHKSEWLLITSTFLSFISLSIYKQGVSILMKKWIILDNLLLMVAICTSLSMQLFLLLPYERKFFSSVSRVWIVLALGFPFCMKRIRTDPLSESRIYKFQCRISFCLD